MTQERKNFIWNLLGLTFNAFNSLFFLVIVKRINGLEVAGSFAFSYAIACLLYALSIYYTRAYQVSSSRYNISDFFASRLFTCLIMFIVSVILCLFIKSPLERYLIILLCLFRNLEAAADVLYGEFHKKERLDYVGKSLFLKAILGIILFFLVDYYSHSILLASLTLILVNGIGGIVDFFNFKKEKIAIISLNQCRVRSLLNDAKSIFIFSFISVLLVNIQKYFIPYFTDNTTEAIFSIIIMPGTMMSLCGQYLINPYANYFTQMFKEKKYEDMKNKMKKLLMVMFIFSIFVSFLLITLGIPILNMIYDLNTRIYQNLFILVILGACFYSMSTLLSSVLTIMDENKVQLYIYVISIIISTLFSYILIKYYKMEGAIFSYLITMLFHFIMYLYIFINKEEKLIKKIRKIKI